MAGTGRQYWPEPERSMPGEARPNAGPNDAPSSMRRLSSTFRGIARAEERRTIDARQWRTFKENELNPLTDLRLLDHIQDVDENLTCAICRCAFVDHVVLECDHAFCRDCLRQTWTEHSPFGPRGNCPTCRKPAKLPSRTNSNRIIANMLDELEVKCPKHEQGCIAVLKRAQVDDHVKLYCDYGRVECSAPQCHEPVSRADAGLDCMHFPVTCIDCHSTMMQAELHAHWSTNCPERKDECENCQQVLPYSKLSMHKLQDCLAARVPCPGHVLGCTIILERKQMETHIKDCVVARIAPFMLAQKQKLEEQEVAQVQMNRRIDVLERGFRNMQCILDEHDLLAADHTHPTLPWPDLNTAEAPVGEGLTHRTTIDFDSENEAHPWHTHPVPGSTPAAWWPQETSVDSGDTQARPNNARTANHLADWPRDVLEVSPASRQHTERSRPQGSRTAPIQHLMSMHETLREEVNRVATALSDLDGRQSMQMLNDNLRVRDELAYLNGAIAGISRQVSFLRSQQTMNPSEAVPREYGEHAGAGVGVEAAVNAVASAASALRGVARMATGAGSSSSQEMGGRLTRRSTNDENRTKL